MRDDDESVSVIIPTYNRGSLVNRAIQSALRQTLSPLEVLVIDDCSDDKSCEIVETLAKQDSRIKLIRMKHKAGAAAARNRGIVAASGKVVAFLDSDDEWMKHHLERKIAKLRENPHAGLAFGSVYLFDGSRRILQHSFPFDGDPLEYLFLRRGSLRTSTFAAPRERLLEVMFDDDLMKHQDWDLAINVVQRFGLVADEQPTAVIHVSAPDRMSKKLNHEGSRRFFIKNEKRVSRGGWVLFATLMLERTFRDERKSVNYYYYLQMVERLDQDAYAAIRMLTALLYVPRIGGKLFRAACRKYYLATIERRRTDNR